jgi:putative transposase
MGAGHLMPDHVHMMICIPPENAASRVIGFVKGQECDPPCSRLWREETQFCGAALLGEGILRLDGRTSRSRHQGVHPEEEQEDLRLDQMNLWR